MYVLLPGAFCASTSSPDRDLRYSAQSSHQLPSFFSAPAAQASASFLLAVPLTYQAFGLPGGLSRLCRWPELDRMNCVLSPNSAAGSTSDGALWLAVHDKRSA